MSACPTPKPPKPLDCYMGTRPDLIRNTFVPLGDGTRPVRCPRHRISENHPERTSRSVHQGRNLVKTCERHAKTMRPHEQSATSSLGVCLDGVCSPRDEVNYVYGDLTYGGSHVLGRVLEFAFTYCIGLHCLSIIKKEGTMGWVEELQGRRAPRFEGCPVARDSSVS